MSTARQEMSPDRNLRRWAAPLVGLTIGIAYLIAAWISGNPVLGLEMFAIMLLFTGGLVIAARRSETVKGLMDGRDERITSIDLKATALAGGVVSDHRHRRIRRRDRPRPGRPALQLARCARRRVVHRSRDCAPVARLDLAHLVVFRGWQVIGDRRGDGSDRTGAE